MTDILPKPTKMLGGIGGKIPLTFMSRDKKVNALLNDEEDIIHIGNRSAIDWSKKFVLFVAGVLFVLFVWFVVAEIYNTHYVVYMRFPTPAESFRRLFELISDNYTVLGSDILTHTEASIMRWIRGFLVAFMIGLLFGVALGISPRFYQFGVVPVTILQTIPGLAWFPVTILLFGFGEESAIFIISITVISPIALSVANGLRKVPVVNMRVAKMAGKSRLDSFFGVLLPFSILDILTGVRIGMANGWRMLISAEMIVGVAVGLGFAIRTLTGYLQYVSAFACIIIICCVGIIIDKIVLGPLESYARQKLGVERK